MKLTNYMSFDTIDFAMKEEDYKKILQYVIKDINAFDSRLNFMLIERPFVSAMCCYRYFYDKSICEIVGLLCDMECDCSVCFLCGTTYRDFFTNIKRHIKNGTLGIVDAIPANLRDGMRDRLVELFSMPLEKLAIDADLTND